MGRMQGKVALVTGAAAGIGRAAAKLLAAEGAAVVLADLDEGGLAETAAGLQDALALRADITDPEENVRLVAEAEKRFGGLDAAVLNAGIEGAVKDIVDYPVEVFDRLMAINVRGPFLGLKAAIPAMKRRGGGSVVITSSTSGIRATPGLSAYTTSKHAVIGLMRAAALELTADNIRVNTVNPGPVDTRMIHALMDQMAPSDPAAAEAARKRGVPMHRYGRPEEVARLMLFLLSDDSGFCTGGVYMADGGISAGTPRPR